MGDLARMPLDTSAYLSDTGHLKTIEHGAYLLILMALWRSTDGWVAGDDNYLARATRMTLGRWKRIAPTVRALLVSKDGKVSQKRVIKDRKSVLSPAKEIPTENPIREAKPLKTIDPISKTPPAAPLAPESALPSLFGSSFESEDRKQERKKVKGRILPPDWRPAEAERLYARTVHSFTNREIDASFEKMRRWATANAHRAVARKSDWNATFRNWIDGDAEKKFDRSRTAVQTNGTKNGHAGNILRIFEIGMEIENESNDENMDHRRALPAPTVSGSQGGNRGGRHR